MTHKFTLQDMRTYLIVGNVTNEIYDTIGAGFGSTTMEKACAHLAKRAVKACARFYEEQCRIVRAVCDPVSGDAPWCCGKTFTQAEANYKKGIHENWFDF